jgi:hypothetical protein
MMAVTTAAAMLLALSAAASDGQPNPGAQLFSSPKYAGRSLDLAGPATHLGGMVVKSIRLPAGTSWDLCSGNTYTGCKRFSASSPAMVFVVRSARPVEAAIAGNGAAAAGVASRGGEGPTMRGVASQFYVEPTQGGVRVEANDQAAGGEAAAALRFCQAHGWQRSAYERVQIINGRRLLADVLCVLESR